MTPDVNVLVAASRADHPHYQIARQWLEGALGDTGADMGLELLPMVIAGFLRLVTNRRVFPDPTPTQEAIALWTQFWRMSTLCLGRLVESGQFSAMRASTANSPAMRSPMHGLRQRSGICKQRW